MSGTQKIPFNISLLELTDDKLKNIRPVTVLDAFEGASTNFHPNGLFSTEIFGKVGQERRLRAFSYINIKLEILHPVVFRILTDMKTLYLEIMNGKAYATWNDEIKDFEKSNPMDGSTGYNFFYTHYKDIVFEQRPSTKRQQGIALLSKYKNKSSLSKIVVLPAGMRDMEIQGDGRFSEDEINVLYKELIALSNNVSMDAIKNNVEILDNTRFKMQATFNQIYDLLENMIQGKKKLMMGKWASRKVFNGTRNVITSIPINNKELNNENNISINNVVCGLYQFLKAALPISLFNLRSGFLSKVFVGPNSPVFLVNKNTLKRETLQLRAEYYDNWMTDEGLEKIISLFQEEGIRHKPLEINGYYLGLIYKSPEGTFKIFQDIDELPTGLNKKDVYPLTFCELLYISVYKVANTLPGFVTRYPITGTGSIYPSMIYLKTTVVSEKRRELDDDWHPIEGQMAIEFPKPNTSFVNSLSPHSSHLQKLGADFDGDWNI